MPPETGSGPARALFVHHSVGGQLLHAGRLRELLADAARNGAPSVQLWDHDYNAVGLTDGNGRRLGRSFPVPDDNTDPPGLLRLAAGDGGSAPYLAELRGFDVVLMKSCFPNNAIKDDAAFRALQATYEEFFQVLSGWTSTTTVLLTSPPLNPRHTSRTEAARAVQMAEWLVGAPKPPRVHVFDLFGVLSADTGRHAGMLKGQYRRRFRMPDSHPNDAGSRDAASALADYLSASWAGLVAGAARS
jgi:hypothetical protein